MSKEGYLIYHEESRRSQIYYCVLGEGKLQFYSRRENGVLIKEVELSKSRLKVRGVADHEARNCAFSFSVSVHRSKIVGGRQVVIGKPMVLVLTAPSWAERKAWGNAIHAWQRHYWGEPLSYLGEMSDDQIDAFFAEQLRSLEFTVKSASVPTSAMIGNPSRLFFSRAQSIKKMGTQMKKKLRSASVTISLPPMGIAVTSSLQQQQPPSQLQPQQMPTAVN
ncbi:hypothetical protein Poli38472_003705 [Pythium oligandrum]|uniref:PH domain-containing protein n=1 Tax=Pythium oligandrum TaxID=41045 RepID=A0A8K1FJC9_PYTOL|nr:hypothetical protein Poli38472_003705 [Pythium oligandrum]|eukprot:TMW65940.1 hypothetical protein Poli38472_003705 [Pythium oligandrum]